MLNLYYIRYLVKRVLTDRRTITLALRFLAIILFVRLYNSYVRLPRIQSSRRKKKITNKVVLVTGGAGGVGSALATEFAKKGARLALWDINVDGLAKVKQSLMADFGINSDDIKTYACDVTKTEKIYECAKQVETDFGEPVTTLVNCAGIVQGKYLIDSDDRKIELMFKLNAMAPLWITKAFLPGMMKQRNGQIVNISSLAGQFGSPKMVDYCTTKFGLRGMNEALRAEFSKQGYANDIQTMAVFPGPINTGLFKGFAVPGVPIMTGQYVASQVVQGIETNESNLYLPPLLKIGVMFKGIMLTEVFDFFMQLQNNAMDAFNPSKANTAFATMNRH